MHSVATRSSACESPFIEYLSVDFVPLPDSPLTRTAEDCALMMAAIAGHDPNDGAISHAPVPDFTAGLADGIKGLRVGVVTEADGAAVDEEVRGALAASVEVLRSLGAETVPVRLAHLM